MMIFNISLVLFAVSILFIATTGRPESGLKMFSLQGVLLFFMVVSHRDVLDLPVTSILSIETLFVRAAIVPITIRYIINKLETKRETEVPLFIDYMINKLEIKRSDEPYIGHLPSLAIATAVMVASLVGAALLKRAGSGVDVLALGVSASSVVTGLFLIVNRKKQITQVMGFLLIENGAFVLSLALDSHMPYIVLAGISMDVFLAIFLIGLSQDKKKSTVKSPEFEKLLKQVKW